MEEPLANQIAAQQARRRAEALFNRRATMAFLFLIGLILDAGGLYGLFRQMQASVTTGTVLYLVKTRDSKGREQEYPFVQFLTADGQVITFRSPVPASLRQVGSSVGVRYDPANPWGASINSFWESWAMQLVLCLVGGLTTWAVGRALLQEFRKPKNDATSPHYL